MVESVKEKSTQVFMTFWALDQLHVSFSDIGTHQDIQKQPNFVMHKLWLVRVLNGITTSYTSINQHYKPYKKSIEHRFENTGTPFVFYGILVLCVPSATLQEVWSQATSLSEKFCFH